jgi:hypothetical protein
MKQRIFEIALGTMLLTLQLVWLGLLGWSLAHLVDLI